MAYPKPQTFKHKSTRSDFENLDKQRFLLDFPNLLRGLQPPMNLIIEIRSPDENSRKNFTSTAWTVMPLFNPANELNLGQWRLPVYECPTLLNIDLLDICN